MTNVYKNAVYVPTTTANTTVYTCNATARAIIQNIQLANQTGSHLVEVFVYDASTTTTSKIAHVSMGSNSTENFAKGPIVLEEGDTLLIGAASTVVTGIVSILEINRGLGK